MSGDSGGGTCNVVFKPLDDSPFSLQSFDSATFFPGTSGGCEVIGTYEAGGTVSASFNLGDTFAHYVLPAGFTGLDHVTVRNLISGGYRSDSGVSLDNLEINAVPEPASMTILGLGVAALIRRRRR